MDMSGGRGGYKKGGGFEWEWEGDMSGGRGIKSEGVDMSCRE